MSGNVLFIVRVSLYIKIASSTVRYVVSWVSSIRALKAQKRRRSISLSVKSHRDYNTDSTSNTTFGHLKKAANNQHTFQCGVPV